MIYDCKISPIRRTPSVEKINNHILLISIPNKNLQLFATSCDLSRFCALIVLN